jgi:drug/metabolite transporter (DMT)-like permease
MFNKLGSYSSDDGKNRNLAIGQALLVTFVWSLSWVLIKVGLEDVPPLLFAGLRYGTASLCLVAILLSNGDARRQVQQLTWKQWGSLTLLGVVYYTITQGAQFLALGHLPAVMLSLMLNFTTALVVLFGVFINEYPNRYQWMGMGLFVLGALIYFGPQEIPSTLGLLFGFICVVFNAISSVWGRIVNRRRDLSPLVVTTISMSIGSALMLLGGVMTEDMPALSVQSWGIVIWLGVVHTAFAFTLWNLSLQHLQAFESSIINSTMLIQIAILAWLFLGETISLTGLIGLIFATMGTLVVQIGKNPLQLVRRRK